MNNYRKLRNSQTKRKYAIVRFHNIYTPHESSAQVSERYTSRTLCSDCRVRNGYKGLMRHTASKEQTARLKCSMSSVAGSDQFGFVRTRSTELRTTATKMLEHSSNQKTMLFPGQQLQNKHPNTLHEPQTFGASIGAVPSRTVYHPTVLQAAAINSATRGAPTAAA